MTIWKKQQHVSMPIKTYGSLSRWVLGVILKVRPGNIEEFDWWESVAIGTVRITSAPANHNSGRGLFDSNTTLWSSWAIQAEAGSVLQRL